MNPTDDPLRGILASSKTIAVVGCSTDPAKTSHQVAAYLQTQGYRIIPVNPRGGEILGETVYPDLLSVPHPIDLVDVFRPPEDCAEIARQAVAIGAQTFWLQSGITSTDAAALASAGNLAVVMDRCTMQEHRRLLG